MPRFTKEVLRVGRHLKQGQWVNVTANDIEDFHKSINQLAEKTLQIPLILEHVEPSEDQTEGVPMTLDEMKSSKLKRTVGYIAADSAKLNEGRLTCDFEVPDVKTAKQIKNKLIRFLSPELRPKGWTHKLTGEHFDKVLSHVALTHTPIQCDQAQEFETIALSDFDGVLCFSAEEMEESPKQDPIQFADHPSFHEKDGNTHIAAGSVDGDGGNDPPNVQPENPDMPKGDETQKLAQMDAILAHLNNVGIAMPADTGPDNFFDRILTALMTVEATKASVEKGKPKQENPEDEQVDEAANETTMRFSDENRKHREKLGARVITLHGQGKVPSKDRDKLLLQLGTAEFSGDGEEVVSGVMSIGDILALADSNPGVFATGSPQVLLRNRITQLSTGDDAKILPGMAENLLSHIPSLQFSDGEEVESGSGLTLTSLLDTFEAGASQMSILLSDVSGDDYSEFGIKEEKDARGKEFTDGDPTIRMGDEAAAEVTDELKKRNPGMFKKEPAAV